MIHATLADNVSFTTRPLPSLNTLAGNTFRRGLIRENEYRHVVAAGPVGDGADWRANGEALRNALMSIVASAAEPCLLRLAPGVYDLGAAPLQMKAYVDIQGAGEQLTRLTSEVCARSSGTVVGADRSTLRHLSVANTGGGEFAVAIFNDGVAPQLNNLTVETSGGLANYGVYNCNAAAPAMTNLRVITSGRRSNIAVYNDGASPLMTHVSALAAGGYFSYAIYNCDGAAPEITHVDAIAAGGDRNVGVYNDENTWPTMTSVTARALGGIDNVDVYND